MKQIRIWFDHYLLLEDTLMILRDSDKKGELTFIGSHSDPIRLASTNYDEKYLMEKTDDKTYLQRALRFCQEKDVHILSPRYHQEYLQRNKHHFENKGVSLMIPAKADMMEIAKNKVKTFEFLKQKGFRNLPYYQLAHNQWELKVAIQIIDSTAEKVCIKPTNKEGGRGFWILEDDKAIHDSKWLFESKIPSKTISTDKVLSILQTSETFEQLMVMELLEGTEYSADCIAEKGELKGAVVRTKPMNSYVRNIVEHEEIVHLAKEIAHHFQFHGVFNLQFFTRKGENVPLLLEINPRFSGGVALSALSGYNLPLGAINLCRFGHVGEIGEIKTNITIEQIKHGVPLVLSFPTWE